jgi:hypothetical protein
VSSDQTPPGGRRLVIVERADHAGPPRPGTDVLVLDASFIPQPGGRTDLIALRPALERVLDRVDLFQRSVDVLDRWAEAVDAPARFRIGDMTWWFRVRLTARWPIHEIALWHEVLTDLGIRGRYSSIELPASRPNVVAAARLVGGTDAADRPAVLVVGSSAGGGTTRSGAADGGVPGPGSAPPVRTIGSLRDAAIGGMVRGRGLASRGLVRTRRALLAVRGVVTGSPPPPTRRERRILELDRRVDVLARRIEALRSEPGAVLVVATAGFFQLIGSERGQRFADPHLAPIDDRLVARGIPVVTLGLQLDHRHDADWRMIESQPTLVPQSIIAHHWGHPDDEPVALPELDSFLAEDDTVVDVGGTDFGPVVRSTLAAEYGGDYLASQARTALRAERLVADLRPRAMVLDHEGGRTAYIAGAHRNGVPVVAVQHGIIVEGNAEYCHPLHELLVRPDVTCVYGDFEREMLTGRCGFAPASVVVTGSSRAGPILAFTPAGPDERAVVRRELGVRDPDRMLVVSLAHNPVAGDLHTMNMVIRTLGGPLPGIHVVLKLHPQERSESRYAQALADLASAGGYDPPRTTVIRDIDLYRLLRAADAHLGQYSTILTDAVVAGIPNMVAVGYAWSDLLGYAAAGVADPVRTVDDVRAFMRDPRPPDPAARAAFLDAHFLPGDASDRIVDVLLGEIPSLREAPV